MCLWPLERVCLIKLESFLNVFWVCLHLYVYAITILSPRCIDWLSHANSGLHFLFLVASPWYLAFGSLWEAFISVESFKTQQICHEKKHKRFPKSHKNTMEQLLNPLKSWLCLVSFQFILFTDLSLFSEEIRRFYWLVRSFSPRDKYKWNEGHADWFKKKNPPTPSLTVIADNTVEIVRTYKYLQW